MRVKFSDRYEHTFPSRAMLSVPAGYSGSVKREVGEAAIAAGVAKEITAKADPDKPKRTRGRPPRVVAATETSGGGGHGDPDKPPVADPAATVHVADLRDTEVLT